MTPEQHKQFSDACTRFGDALAKIFSSETVPNKCGRPIFMDENGAITTMSDGKPLKIREERIPTFTTSDGVDFFNEDDAVWVFYSATQKGTIKHQCYKDIDEMDWAMMGAKLYSTLEAAEKAYDTWLKEQPVLSLKDISFYDVGEDYWNDLKEIVKEKIAKR